jgi:hypothetical protein
MDFAALTDITARAGFTIDWAALIRLSARHPEPVLDWVAAAGQYAAADTAHRLLTATAATLRDLMAGTAPAHLYQHADQLSEVCDLLTETDQARDDAMGQLSGACLDLAVLDPAALTSDPDGPTPPPPPPPRIATASAVARACRALPPGPRRRPRHRQP